MRSDLLSTMRSAQSSLILENLFERIIMRDGRIGLALARQFDWIVGEASIGDRLAVDNRDHAVDGQARANGRPIEGLHQAAWAKRGPRSR